MEQRELVHTTLRRRTKDEMKDVMVTPPYRDSVRERNAEIVRNTELEEWDPRTLPENFYVVEEGKRRTGKTTFAKWMLQYYKKKFSLAWCMTNTRASGYWQKLVGSKFTFDGWHGEAIENLIARNDKIIEKYGEESPQAKEYAALVILDDIISDTSIHYDKTFTRLASEGRHHLISVVLMTQDPHAINPKTRDNADMAVIFNQKTQRNKESVWRDFMNDVNKDVGLGLLSKFAVEHDALVCMQTNLNGNIKKNYFKSTVDKTVLEDPKYALGGKKQVEMVLEERALKKRQKQLNRASRKSALR